MLHKSFQEVQYSTSECDYKFRLNIVRINGRRWKKVFGTEISEVGMVSEY